LGEEVEVLMEYVLEYLEFALRYNYVTTEDVTTTWLDKKRDGPLGMVHVTLARRVVFHLVAGWVDELKRERPTGSVADELLDVLDNFSSYRRFMARFDSSQPSNDPNSSEGPDEHAASRGLGGTGLDPVAALKNLYKNKASHLVVDFMCDLMMSNHDACTAEAVNAQPVKT
jgi:hypothetical protein